jgi:hypothetical protein
MRPITPADLGQKEFKEEVDIFKTSATMGLNRQLAQLASLNKQLAQLRPPSPKLTENEVHMPGEVSVHPIVKTDYKGEKFGTTTTYEVRWAGGVAVCKTAEAAAQIALALSEKAAP